MKVQLKIEITATASVKTNMFKCNECDITFKKRSRLREHSIIHTGLKPFKCDQCNKAYNSQSNLRKHKTIHENHELACPQCKKIFSAGFKLKQHLTIRHTIHNQT